MNHKKWYSSIKKYKKPRVHKEDLRGCIRSGPFQCVSPSSADFKRWLPPLFMTQTFFLASSSLREGRQLGIFPLVYANGWMVFLKRWPVEILDLSMLLTSGETGTVEQLCLHKRALAGCRFDSLEWGFFFSFFFRVQFACSPGKSLFVTVSMEGLCISPDHILTIFWPSPSDSWERLQRKPGQTMAREPQATR